MLKLDAAGSSIRIHTFAEGLLSRLAHDLELVCRGISGTVEGETATLTVDVDRIAVAGAVKHGKVDPNVLSAAYCEEILAKMRREVFHDASAVSVSADRAKVTVAMNERSVETRLPAAPSTDPDGATRAKGSIELSLQALGAGPVKGPMNAFRVKDRVEVLYDVVFR